MAVLGAVLVRFVVVAGVAWLAMWVANLGVDGKGANIGAGLAAFGVTILVSAIWAFLDGRRVGQFAPVALRWLIVGVLLGVLGALQAQWGGPAFDRDVFGSDLRTVTPFIFGLVAVPAAIGAAVGASARRADT